MAGAGHNNLSPPKPPAPLCTASRLWPVSPTTAVRSYEKS